MLQNRGLVLNPNNSCKDTGSARTKKMPMVHLVATFSALLNGFHGPRLKSDRLPNAANILGIITRRCSQ